MKPGTETRSAMIMAGGVALHGLAWLLREQTVLAYLAGVPAAIALAYGCGKYLDGKGYPAILGIPAAFLSVVWIWVAFLVPDREYRELPAEQLPASSTRAPDRPAREPR